MMNSKLNEKIQAVLDRATAEGAELGAQVTVYRDGELLVDAFSGWCDPERTKRVDADTVFPVFSAGKAVTATAALRLVEQGKLSYETPVCSLWPEFAANGKEKTTLRMILSHRSGVCDEPSYAGYGELADWDLMCARVAAAAPAFEPGTRTRYQAITWSWLLGETVRRAGGRPFPELLRELVFRPAGMDRCFFGLPPEMEPHTAVPVRGGDLPVPGPADDPLESRMKSEAIRRACLAGFNCMANARSLAGHYRALPELLTPETLEFAATLDRHPGDPLPAEDGPWLLFGQGYALLGPRENPGTRFGHGGYGGSEGFYDRERKLAVAFTKNLLHINQPAREEIYGLLGLRQ